MSGAMMHAMSAIALAAYALKGVGSTGRLRSFLEARRGLCSSHRWRRKRPWPAALRGHTHAREKARRVRQIERDGLP